MTQREINEKYLSDVKHFSRHDAKISLDDNGDIMIEGGFNCSYKTPNFIKDGKFIITFSKVTAEFDCKKCNLKSLEGCPKVVGSYFNCSFNSITSLENCPQDVAADFNCGHNYISTLKHSPKRINKNFDCSYNDLEDLKDGPTYIGGNFSCKHNKLNTLRDKAEYIGGSINCAGNNIQLKEVPKNSDYFAEQED